MPRVLSARPAPLVALLLGLAMAGTAQAADGQVIITQAKVLAGNVTPGDTPGFPLTLSRTGSYVFGTGLQAPKGVGGIVVTAVEVTIDLNGFRLNGDRSVTANTNGITGTQRNLVVRNGIIRNFTGSGVVAGHGLMVADMMIVENGRNGVSFADGSGYGRIIRNSITQNGLHGIECGEACHIEGNNLSGNINGVVIYSGTVLGNTINDNAQYGISSSFVTTRIVGAGNNTLSGNRIAPINGYIRNLQPNLCAPTACP